MRRLSSIIDYRFRQLITPGNQCTSITRHVPTVHRKILQLTYEIIVVKICTRSLLHKIRFSLVQVSLHVFAIADAVLTAFDPQVEDLFAAQLKN